MKNKTIYLAHIDGQDPSIEALYTIHRIVSESLLPNCEQKLSQLVENARFLEGLKFYCLLFTVFSKSGHSLIN